MRKPRHTRTKLEAYDYISPILPLMQRGLTMKQACQYTGIPETTVRKYMRDYEIVKKAIDTALMMLIATASDTVAKAAKKDPNIALKVLEKRSRETYGDRIDITTNGESLNVAWLS